MIFFFNRVIMNLLLISVTAKMKMRWRPLRFIRSTLPGGTSGSVR